MRKLLRIAIGVAMLGALMAAPTAAFASHGTSNGTPLPGVGKGSPGDATGWHEDAPTPEAGGENTCVVDGIVNTRNDGVHPPDAPTFTHSHYQFEETGMTCVDGDGNPFTLDVDADGGFDGPEAGTDYGVDHGSSNPTAYSHCSEYSGTGSPSSDAEDCDESNANRGDISVVDSRGTCTGDGHVKFVRAFTNVVAWGQVGSCSFSAELVFTPILNEPAPSTHTHQYNLDGAALVG